MAAGSLYAHPWDYLSKSEVGMQDQELQVKGLPVVFGDWDKETVMLDFDCTPLGEVKLWAYRMHAL